MLDKEAWLHFLVMSGLVLIFYGSLAYVLIALQPTS